MLTRPVRSALRHFGNEKRTNQISSNINSARFWGNAVCDVGNRMTSTGAYGLFVRVGEFIAERETLSTYVERMEMFITANN